MTTRGGVILSGNRYEVIRYAGQRAYSAVRPTCWAPRMMAGRTGFGGGGELCANKCRWAGDYQLTNQRSQNQPPPLAQLMPPRANRPLPTPHKNNHLQPIPPGGSQRGVQHSILVRFRTEVCPAHTVQRNRVSISPQEALVGQSRPPKDPL